MIKNRAAFELIGMEGIAISRCWFLGVWELRMPLATFSGSVRYG
jgi:hypothetical protein